MIEIIKERQPTEHIEYRREFEPFNKGACGYSFPCKANGELMLNNDDAKKNYEHAVSHPDLYEDQGIKKIGWWYTEPAVGRCRCGKEFELTGNYMGACKCPNCERWYNEWGQELLDPEYWEDDDYDY